MEVALTFINAKGEIIWHLGEIFFLIILATFFKLVMYTCYVFLKLWKILSIYIEYKIC